MNRGKGGGRKLDDLTSKGRCSVCECERLYGCVIPVRGFLQCHRAILGNEGLSREVRLLDVLKLPLIITCSMTELFGGGNGG